MTTQIAIQLGSDWREKLFELLQRQQVVCHELLERCKSQTDLLAASESQKLLGILHQRQELIDELGELSISLEPFRQLWPELWQNLKPGEQQRVRAIVDEIQDIVETVKVRDQRDQEALRIERNRIRSEMDSVNTGRRSNAAYGSPVHRGVEPVTNRFTDARG